MADIRERETIYAVPEFYVYVYRSDPSCMMNRLKLTPDEAQLHRDFHAKNGDWPGYTPTRHYDLARATWQMRDMIEAQDGAIVWSHQDWWIQNSAIHAAHGVRKSVKMSGLLAYYQDATKACLGILTPIKPGRYLAKFFSEVLSEKERTKLARWQESGSYPSDYANETAYPLVFADTRKAIRAVYEDGPSSCMSGPIDGFSCGNRHPCEVYAAGDLAIAYITDAANDGPVARALCWPERKVFGRVYPTEDNWAEDKFADYEDALSMQNTLRNRLLAMDYKQDERHGRVSFNGAKLLRIELDEGYVMPYLDNAYRVDNHGDHFVMNTSGDMQANNTDGTMEQPEDDRPTCERCNDPMDDEDMNSVYTHVNSSGGRGEQTWCDCCVENRTFRCDGFDEVFDDDVDHVEVDNNTYTEAYARENFTKSDHSDEWFSGGEVTVDGETWSEDEFSDDGFTCAIADTNHANSNRHPDYPEIHKDTDTGDIAAWLIEAGRIDDAAQLELAA